MGPAILILAVAAFALAAWSIVSDPKPAVGSAGGWRNALAWAVALLAFAIILWRVT